MKEDVLFCPFCGKAFKRRDDKTGICDTCGLVISVDFKTRSAVVQHRKSSPKYVIDTYAFLRKVKNNNVLAFGPKQPFSMDFDMDQVIFIDDDTIKNYKLIQRIEDEDLDLLAVYDTCCYNINKLLFYFKTRNAKVNLTLSQFTSVGHYVYTMSCLNTLVTTAEIDRTVSSRYYAIQLPFLEGIVDVLMSMADNNIVVPTDSETLYYISTNRIYNDSLIHVDVDNNKDLICYLLKNIKGVNTTLADVEKQYNERFEAIGSAMSEWFECLMFKSTPDLYINSTIDYKVFSPIDLDFKLEKDKGLLKGRNFMSEKNYYIIMQILSKKYMAYYSKVYSLDQYKKPWLSEQAAITTKSSLELTFDYWRYIQNYFKLKLKELS